MPRNSMCPGVYGSEFRSLACGCLGSRVRAFRVEGVEQSSGLGTLGLGKFH